MPVLLLAELSYETKSLPLDFNCIAVQMHYVDDVALLQRDAWRESVSAVCRYYKQQQPFTCAVQCYQTKLLPLDFNLYRHAGD